MKYISYIYFVAVHLLKTGSLIFAKKKDIFTVGIKYTVSAPKICIYFFLFSFSLKCNAIRVRTHGLY